MWRISQNEIAKKLGISKSYLSSILNGKRGCSETLKNELIKYYPDLKFKILKPRYTVEKVGEIDE
jgi:transcriptional regulator with XRE-family HTH domain